MRLALVVASVAWLAGAWRSAAFAEPVPVPEAACSVTIVAAPERVRAEIEAWVAAERRCSHTLVLRIEATAGALHVFARDDLGRVRERVVPDDQSVGALIVSWIADDAPAEPAPVAPVVAPVAEPPAPPAPLPPATPIPVEVVSRPRVPTSEAAPAGVAASLLLQDSRQEWMTLVGALSMSEAHKFGVRADRDLTSRTWWSLGIFAAQLENSQSGMGISISSAGGFFAAESNKGDWQLRAQAGLGGGLVWLRNYCDCDQMGVGARTHQFTLRPIADLSVLIGHALGARWSFAGGALLSAALIDYGIETQDRVSVMMFAGFRSRL